MAADVPSLIQQRMAIERKRSSAVASLTFAGVLMLLAIFSA